MDRDLLTLVKKLKDVNNLDELNDLKELGESFLRNQKREAILTLMSISEEMGEEEILNSIKDLSGYLESIVRQGKK
jgi:hypothetical protein